ncbi:CDKL [Mytilus edulis]|uniref:CDKL n=1 Tax=Mytilus edulis TaxID=6550 RepID=A0A8S3QNV2_MYTED|nr:CDKL [Mytilus edulis]
MYSKFKCMTIVLATVIINVKNHECKDYTLSASDQSLIDMMKHYLHTSRKNKCPSKRKPSNSGVTCVHWGKKGCPKRAEIVYSGQVGRNDHTTKGGGVNYLCLPNDPENGHHQSFGNDQIFGGEYRISSSDKPSGWSESMRYKVPCSVCYKKHKSTVLVIPGNLTARHKEVFLRNPLFVGMRIPEVKETVPLEKKFNRISSNSLDLMKQSLRLDPDDRPTCTQLLKHEFFQKDGFITRIQHDLKQKVHRETHNNPLIKTSSSEKEDGDDAKGSNIKKKKKINDLKDNKDANKKDNKKETEKLAKKTSQQNTSLTPVNAKSPSGDSQKEKEKNNQREKEKTMIKDSKVSNNVKERDNKIIKDQTKDREKNDKIDRKSDKENEKDVKENGEGIKETTPSIPPIANNAGQTNHISTTNNPQSMPSITSPFPSMSPFTPTMSPGSFTPSLSPSVASVQMASPIANSPIFFGPPPLRDRGTPQAWVSDKMVKKTPSHMQKKNLTNHHSSTLSPQPFQSEKSFLHEKLKSKSPDKREKEGLSFPEVKGAEAHPTKTKPLQPKQRTTIAQIPHITNIDPFPFANADTNGNGNDKDDNLPTV